MNVNQIITQRIIQQMKEALEKGETVSYTHLDVYKRQV